MLMVSFDLLSENGLGFMPKHPEYGKRGEMTTAGRQRKAEGGRARGNSDCEEAEAGETGEQDRAAPYSLDSCQKCSSQIQEVDFPSSTLALSQKSAQHVEHD